MQHCLRQADFDQFVSQNVDLAEETNDKKRKRHKTTYKKVHMSKTMNLCLLLQTRKFPTTLVESFEEKKDPTYFQRYIMIKENNKK